MGCAKSDELNKPRNGDKKETFNVDRDGDA